MTKHELKLNHRFFDAVSNGMKTFEIRRFNRDFGVGDTLVLRKTDDNGKIFQDDYAEVSVKVTYILTHEDFPDGICEGYVVMGIAVI